MENDVDCESSGHGEDNEAGVAAVTASTSYVFPFVLNAAVQLDLFSIIGDAAPAQISTSDIASRLPIRGRAGEAAAALDSMLRLLASYSLLTLSTKGAADGVAGQRRYGLTPSGKFFVRDESTSLVKYQELFYYNAENMTVCQNLKDAVLGVGDANLFERLNGKPFYEYVNSNPGYRKLFHGAMRAHSVLILGKVLEKYNGFENLLSIVDVGGCDGATLEMIISKYPSIRGINFDLPEVIQNAPSYQGIEHVGGDMFVEVPKAEAILLKHMLHNWSDEQSLLVLRNCYRALPENKVGKVIVLECMIPDVPSTDMHSKYVCQLDVIMLTLFGSKQRTKDEFKSLAKAAGFMEFNVACNAHSMWVMEFIKHPKSNTKG